MQLFFQRLTATVLCLVCGLAMIEGIRGSDLPAATAVRSVERLSQKREQDGHWTLVAVGDIMLSRFVDTTIERSGDPTFPFLYTKEILQDGDITFANLENPVAPGKKMPNSGLVFRMDPEMAPILRDAGFDVVSLANNHMTDTGIGVVKTTRDILWDAGIAHTGAGTNETEARSPAFFTINGTRIAFLAYGDPRFSNQTHFATATSPGIAKASSALMAEDITAAKMTADVVIVSLHAGGEYRITPDFTQRTFAEAAIDGGADLVLGHHPHVLQPIEIYKGKPIVYSLGNFIFDQSLPETKQGVIMRFFFKKNDLLSMAAVPVTIHEFAQPRPANEADAAWIIERLNFGNLPAY